MLLLVFSLSFSLSCFCLGCAPRKAPALSGARAKLNAGANSNPALDKSTITPLQDTSTKLHAPEHPSRVEGLGETSAVPNALGVENFISHQAHNGEINSLVVTRDGHTAYSAGADGKVVRSRMVATTAKKLAIETQTLLKSPKPIFALALSSDEKKLAVSEFSHVVVYDLEGKKLTNSLSRVEGRVTSMAWDPRQELLALGRSDGDVFVWNLSSGPDAGQDSDNAIESYGGGGTAVMGLAFHPSGRTLFVAERRGLITLWRLLRTEREMGLRDEDAVIDSQRVASKRAPIADLKIRVEDAWLDSEGRYFSAAVSDGAIYRWKVRGLVLEDKIVVGRDADFSVSGLNLSLPGNGVAKMLASTGRGQKIKFWCNHDSSNRPTTLPRTAKPEAVVDILDTPAALPTRQNKQEMDEAVLAAQTSTEVLEGVTPHSRGDTANPLPFFGEIKEGDAKNAGPIGPLVAETELFANAVNIIRSGAGSSILWAAQKTGNLLTFNPNVMLKSPQWLAQARRCQGSINN